MKTRKKLLAAGLVGILGALAVPTAASAAQQHPVAFDPESPSIVMIGDHPVNQKVDTDYTIRGGDRKPVFTMMAGDPTQVGHQMVIDDLNVGRICSATVQPNLLASCTPENPLELGRVDLSAYIDDGDGNFSWDSDRFWLGMGYAYPTAQLDSYDPVTGVARLSGTATTSTVYFGLKSIPVDPTTGVWKGEIVQKDPLGSVNVSTRSPDGQVGSSVVVWLPGAQLDAPRASARVTGSTAVIDVVGTPDAWALVLDSSGKYRGETQLIDGSGQISFPTSGKEEHYDVVQYRLDKPRSAPTPVTVNAGAGQVTPEAPVVGTPTKAGSRIVVPVSGDAGSIATIKSLDGKVIAVRTVGASGKSEVLVPAQDALRAGESATALTAELSRSGFASPATVFTVVSS